MFAARARLLITTLWVGSLWTFGYLAAPILFTTLSDNRALAGTLAGAMFRIEAWLSVGCALALIALSKADDNGKTLRSQQWLVVGMLACTLIGYFGLQPFMAALREAAGAGGMMDADAKARFGFLHGVSSAFYLAQSLLGVGLVLKLR